MRCLLYFLLFILVIPRSFSQEKYNKSYFGNPVDHKIILAGSFAELRSTHFHSGIDIKPSSSSVDTVRSAARGYISRIKIQTGGYGQAIYINHPNGHTTVYAHLSELNEPLTKYIRNLQKKTKSYAIELYPDSTLFQVKKGTHLGLMGNTGQSYAKHLHFEIRETKTEIPVNPALWGIKPKDDIPPRVLAVDLHSLTPDFQTIYKKTYFPAKLPNHNYKLEDGQLKFPAWRCGVATQAFDMMNGASNKNGIYYQKMYVDDTLYFAYTLDKVAFHESKYINSHVDFSTKEKEERTTVRCYTLPGNKLSIYDSLRNNGIIKLYEKKGRKIKITLGDIEGNESNIYFNLFRDGSMERKGPPNYNTLVKVGKGKSLSFNGAHIYFPHNALDKNLYFSYSNKIDFDGRMIYTLGDPSLILFRAASLTLPIPSMDQNLKEKIVVAYSDGEDAICLGGKIKNDSISIRWRSGGDFFVTLDTIKPTIALIKLKKAYKRGEEISATIKDTFGDNLNYSVKINGQWHISPFKDLINRLTIPLNENILVGENKLLIEASDGAENTTILEKSFNIIE